MHLKGQTVLVTGAGGSIGSELVKKIIAAGLETVLLLDISETNLYEIHEKSKAWAKDGVKVVPLLADVRHRAVVESVFERWKPKFTYHAAALKHVPMLEDPHNRIEAVRTNILGTKRVLDAAIANVVDAQIVVISTDKAVNPRSVMGLTKRVAELYAEAVRGPGHKVLVTRFGNVLGSSGSVVPLFQKQIDRGGPITITHKEMTRFMMAIGEAVDLVLLASGWATSDKHSDGLFVLDMGKPVKIEEVAEKCCRLAGYTPRVDIAFKYIGLRPGEKLHEELFYRNEIPMEQVLPGLSYVPCKPFVSKGIVQGCLEALEVVAEERRDDRIQAILKELVPEYDGDMRV